MYIKFGEEKTKYGPCISIELTGDIEEIFDGPHPLYGDR